jgi:hypothetical protein
MRQSKPIPNTATVPSKDERWDNYRLAKAARGLATAEKKALHFVAEASTMQDGVCSKAKQGVEDFGGCPREFQYGIHGRRRKNKTWIFPGLLARKIVSVSGYTHGGRTLGGRGLTPIYTIDVNVLETYDPEYVAPAAPSEPPPVLPFASSDVSLTSAEKKGEQMGEQKKGEQKGEQYGELMPTRSCSSLSSILTPSALPENFRDVPETEEPPRGAGADGEEGAGSGTTNLQGGAETVIRPTHQPTPGRTAGGRVGGTTVQDIALGGSSLSGHIDCPSRSALPSLEVKGRTENPKHQPPFNYRNVRFEDLQTVWGVADHEGPLALPRIGWRNTADNIGLQEALRQASVLDRKDLVLPAFKRFVEERCDTSEAPIFAPLSVFRLEFQIWVDAEKDRLWEKQKRQLRADPGAHLATEAAVTVR